MERKVFNRHYKEIILPHAKRIAQAYNSRGVALRTVGREDLFEGTIFEEYLIQRTKLRLFYGEDADARLDNHKVCACLTIALINARLLTQSIDDDRPRDKMDLRMFERANEHLALFSAISVLFSYDCKRAQLDKDNRLLEIFSATDPSFPGNSRPDAIDVVSEIVKALYYARVDDTLSLPLLTVMYFYIETYHERTYKPVSAEAVAE